MMMHLLSYALFFDAGQLNFVKIALTLSPLLFDCKLFKIESNFYIVLVPALTKVLFSHRFFASESFGQSVVVHLVVLML